MAGNPKRAGPANMTWTGLKSWRAARAHSSSLPGYEPPARHAQFASLALFPPEAGAGGEVDGEEPGIVGLAADDLDAAAAALDAPAVRPGAGEDPVGAQHRQVVVLDDVDGVAVERAVQGDQGSQLLADA